MKRIQIKFLKSYNAIICVILAILGFASSCDSPKEYGTPSADFIINGKVTDSETNQPIENIRVIANYDSVYTNGNGSYRIVKRGYFTQDETFAITFQDVDGELNGSYQDLDTIVEFKNPVFTGGDDKWDEGETSKQFNVKLTPKK